MVLMMLMFLIVISTASPLLNSVMEEKMTRISEVLLGSLSPFELMAGKLLGVVGVSMVLSALYLSGAYGFAVYHGYGDAVTIGQIVWFVVYLVLAMLIYGSLFIAIGAAATDLKDAQALMTPCMLLFMSPMFIWMPVLRAPGSTLAIVASLVPFATPVLMTLRMALSPAPTGVADRARLRADDGDERVLRLGRRPHLPRRHPHAGQERDVRRDVALGPRRLSAG